ncbi:hypothetical protein EGW08_021251, partial [Elysia chlorotica]
LKKVFVVVGATLIVSPLSLLSYYGNLLPYLASYYHARRDEISIPVDTLWPPSVFRCTFTLAMMFTSPLELRFGQRRCIFGGLLLLWVSIMCCYIAVDEPLAFLLIFGGIHGIPVGIIYPTTLKLLLQALPDRAGLATGVLSIGPVFGALVNIGLAFAVINPNDEKPDLYVDNNVFFSDPGLIQRVPNYFLVSGASMVAYTSIGLVLALIGSSNSVQETESKISDISATVYPKLCEQNNGCTVEEVLRTGRFWCVWLCYLSFSHTAYLHMNLYKQYGQIAIPNDSLLVTTGLISMAGTLVGRPAVGIGSDKIGIRNTLFIMSLCSSVLMSLMVISLHKSTWAYVFLVSIEFLSVSPQTMVFSLLATFEFGETHCASNMGLVTSGNMIIILLEPFIASAMIRTVGWNWLFLTGSM